MAEKLKSISRRIPWSLLLKALAFGLAWLILPKWLAMVLAVILYFRPFFSALRLLVPFAALLVVGLFLPGVWWAAFYEFVIFFLILGLKELIFIDRRGVYGLVFWLLNFMFFFQFFLRVEQAQAASAFWGSLLLALGVFLLARSFFAYEREEHKNNFQAGLYALLVWQLAWVLLFLPMSFFYKTGLLLLGAVTIFELLRAYGEGNLSRLRLRTVLTLFFVIGSLMLAANQWGI